MATITLDEAHEVAVAAQAKAKDIGVPMNIAIVDGGANLTTFGRMDGAWLGSIDIAIKKARTARMFDVNTGDLGPLAQPGQPLYGIEVSNDGLITFGGGVLLRNSDGEIIGALGISGGTVDQDETVAKAGAAALRSAVRV